MARSYMTGYAGSVKNEAGLLAWSVWQRFDPEFARRLKLLMDASIDAGFQCGVGGGWRSAETQRQTFLSRFIPEDDNDFTGDVFWAYTLPSPMYGKPAGYLVNYWEKLPGVAPAAPPGRSYHESTTTSGKCLAADMIGNLKFIGDNASKFGLVHFGNINGEPWHLQPAEIPHSRANYSRTKHEPLAYFGGTPVVPPPAPPKPVVAVPAPTLRLKNPTMSGKEVAMLQQILVFWGWMPAVTTSGKPSQDGWFGSMTEYGVKKMQTALRLTADGVYGPVTAAAYKKFAEAMAGIS